MAPTKRLQTLARNKKHAELMSSLKRDPRKHLSYPPGTFVARRDAIRVWGLSEKDLASLDQQGAYFSKNRGQEGLFYSKTDIRALSQHCQDASLVTDEMIPEVIIIRQLPKSLVNLELLRHLAVRGKKPHSRGTDTYFYKKDEIEDFLGVKIIEEGHQIGIDFIPLDKVPAVIQVELPAPKLGLFSAAGKVFSQAKPCYFPPQVEEILRSSFMNIENFQQQTRSLRRRKGPPVGPAFGGGEIAGDAAGGGEFAGDAAGGGEVAGDATGEGEVAGDAAGGGEIADDAAGEGEVAGDAAGGEDMAVDAAGDRFDI